MSDSSPTLTSRRHELNGRHHCQQWRRSRRPSLAPPRSSRRRGSGQCYGRRSLDARPQYVFAPKSPSPPCRHPLSNTRTLSAQDPSLSGLREISSLASWSVSTHKPSCGVDALRSLNPGQFWQSDGPQPHLLTIHFFKLVRIVKMRVYLDFLLDESYTPTKMQFWGGTGMYDLVSRDLGRSG